MHTLAQDVRYSFRQLGKNRGSTVSALLSLGLGIGATTAVFSVIYAALINPYPYPTADRIVRLTAETKTGPGTWLDLNGPQLRELQQAPVVESVIAMDYHPMTLTGAELAENVLAIGLIANGFSDLGVPPVLGRGILPSDARAGHDPQPVVVLSYRFWQSQFFGEPDIAGKTIQLDHRSYVVVGVAAPRFNWYVGDVYLPLKITADPGPQFMVDILLKDGVSRKTADDALQPLLEEFARTAPKQFPEHFKVRVEPLNEWVERGISGMLYVLLAAVAALLAVGCGNVSILLLARGAARQHELAVRTALGARRSRLVRQLLTESLVLSMAGAALGIAMAYAILALIRLVLPQYFFAPEVVIRINVPVLMFAIVVALATGILFGLWPALQLSEIQPARNITLNVRRVAGSLRHRRTYGSLIAGQVALTLVLLAGAGASMTGFLRLLHKPLGYDPHHVVSIGLPLRDNSFITPEARRTYFEQLLERASRTHGVELAAISSNATPPRNGWNTRFEIAGQAIPEQNGSANLVSPSYFQILRIPVIEGRIWTETENHNGARLAVVNRTFAQRYFPNGRAIGSSVRLPEVEDRPPARLTAPGFADSWLTVTGIVADACNNGLRNPVMPAIYVPWTMSMVQGTQILVRSPEPVPSLVRAVTAQFARINPDQRTGRIRGDLTTWISDLPEWQQEHVTVWIFGMFAVLALILAAVGLYSVVSWTVAQRTNEIGIRVALGAERGHIIWTVSASAFASIGIGVGVGLILAFALSRIVERWVPRDTSDLMVLGVGTVLLGVTGVLACAIPARQASGIDAATALRFE